MKDKIILGSILIILFLPIFICLTAGTIAAYQNGFGLLGSFLLFFLVLFVVGVFSQ